METIKNVWNAYVNYVQQYPTVAGAAIIVLAIVAVVF
jgi:hypothetical protein